METKNFTVEQLKKLRDIHLSDSKDRRRRGEYYLARISAGYAASYTRKIKRAGGAA